ncbi:peroxisomal sarcosine oxidase-like [Liolophura sinensis]|uniref:peroxisomal sarcosine oxidase-like n=1 Tax=Liolophura sinensis TaxID=3198878 RepID=UPI0031593EB0
MAATDTYDAIVIGAGVEGSSTAYHLAKAGRSTLMLEQFPLPHTRGSSHGHSRITRKAYPQDFYVRMMREAYDIWANLEEETGTTVYKKTGLIMIGEDGSPYLSRLEQAIRSSGEHCQRLSPEEFRMAYPMLRYPTEYGAVYDGVAGILYADKSLTALQEMFVKNGGEIRSGEKMTGLFPGEIVTVRTTKRSYKTRSVVICAGPWAPELLKPLGLHLPLKPVRITVGYWRERKPGVLSADNGFPCTIELNAIHGADVYSLPAMEYPGHVKIVLHTGPAINPDFRDGVDDSWVLNSMVKYVKEHFPGVEGERPGIRETCIYTVTPDENFILDTHPHWKNIVIGAGFSGHGFKLAPVVGKVLSELAQGKSPSYDLTPFRIQRFFTKSSL